MRNTAKTLDFVLLDEMKPACRLVVQAAWGHTKEKARQKMTGFSTDKKVK